MPLSLNIGRSIKTSQNYNSSGYSINLTAELDNALLSRPAELQDAIDQLYQQADLALERQMNDHTHPQPRKNHQNQQNAPYPSPYSDSSRPSSPRLPASHSAGSNSSSQSSSSRPQGSSTQSQRRAIEAICHDLNLPLHTVFADLDIQHFDQLSVRQASQLIDQLKAHQNTSGTHISGNQNPHPHPRNIAHTRNSNPQHNSHNSDPRTPTPHNSRNSDTPHHTAQNNHHRPYPDSPTVNTTWSQR